MKQMLWIRYGSLCLAISVGACIGALFIAEIEKYVSLPISFAPIIFFIEIIAFPVWVFGEQYFWKNVGIPLILQNSIGYTLILGLGFIFWFIVGSIIGFVLNRIISTKKSKSTKVFK